MQPDFEKRDAIVRRNATIAGMQYLFTKTQLHALTLHHSKIMKSSTNIIYKVAKNRSEFADAGQLFREYAQSLPIDLTFQGFDHELTIIPVQYNQPTGAVILAYANNQAIGCAGIRKLDDDIAELKRMYVQTGFRGNKIAQQLLTQAIAIATTLHYKTIRLDTIPGMTAAYNLYLANGFYEIEPYRFNPVEGAIYMERKL